VVEGVVGGRVDDILEPVTGDHVAIVDKDGPELDNDEEEHVEVLLHRADIDEDAVGEGVLEALKI
jgi:hypothetical protein